MMTDGGLWSWGDRGLPKPDKILGMQIRQRARVASNEIKEMLRDVPVTGIEHSIKAVRDGADALDPGQRTAFIAERYAALRSADVELLQRLSVPMTHIQTDIVAPLVPKIASRLSTAAGIRALTEMFNFVGPSTAPYRAPRKKPSWPSGRERRTLRDEVRAVSGLLGEHYVSEHELCGGTPSIDVQTVWPRGIEVTDYPKRTRRWLDELAMRGS